MSKILHLNVPMKLPWLGTDTFIALMRAGVRYDKDTRTFLITQGSNISTTKMLLAQIFHDEIIFGKNCFMCNAPLGATDEENGNTNCKDCLVRPDFLNEYQLKTAMLVEQIKSGSNVEIKVARKRVKKK